MRYRKLGKTELMVSEIGLGAEWLERHSAEECKQIINQCELEGINILDCWMSEPNVRSNIGAAINGKREKWIIQGHIGSTWQDGQYVKTRELSQVKEAFQDLLTRLKTDYIDLGMIHFVDSMTELDEIVNGEFYAYVKSLKEKGIIRHIGMSSHNPEVAIKAAELDIVEMILFSINPAFDLFPATDDLYQYFQEEYDEKFGGMDPIRAKLYKVCETKNVGITVMKGYAGGRLLNEKASPFGVALSPIQCIHYALTRPAVAAIMVGFDTIEHVKEAVAYETANEGEKDYATVLAKAPKHAFKGQCTYCGHCRPCQKGIDIAMVNKLYDLALMQPEVPNSIRAHYESLESTAADCISCGGCETRCPFGVPIIDRMKKAKDLLGRN